MNKVRIALILIILLLCSATGFASEINFSDFRRNLSTEELRWLKNNPELTIYTDEDLFPYSFAKADGTTGGVVADVANAIGKRLGLRINLIPIHYKT